MNKILKTIILFYFFFPNFLYAEEAINLNDSISKIFAGKYIEYIEDKEGTLKIDDIISNNLPGKFIKSEKDVIAFRYSKSAYWLKFDITSKADKEKKWLLQISNPLLDYIDLYVYRNKVIIKKIKTGYKENFNTRDYANRNFLFDLPLEKNEKINIYIRVNTRTRVEIPIAILEKIFFLKNDHDEQMMLGFYYGILFFMFFVNFIFLIAMRDVVYFYYIAIITSYSFFMLLQSGLVEEYLHSYGLLKNIYVNAIPLAAALMAISAITMINDFIRPEKYFKYIHIPYKYLVHIIIASLSLYLFLHHTTMILLEVALASTAMGITIIIIIKALISDSRPAKFFMTAFAFAILGGGVFSLKVYGIIPDVFVTRNGLKLGTIMFFALLYFAIGDKVNESKREKEKTQDLLIKKLEALSGELKDYSENLEYKVSERTEELQSTMEELSSINVELRDTRDALWGEMEIAKQIQLSLLPKKIEIPGYEIGAYMNPAADVGGDYYDVLNVDGNHWIIVGDVSGHGVPAGLIMMMVATSIHHTLYHYPDISPDELLIRINRTLFENLQRLNEALYMTITVLSCDDNGKFTFSGLHQDILIYRKKTKEVDILETGGFWLGVVEDIDQYLQVAQFQMEPGDVMLLYSDGITEAWKEGTVRNYRDPELHMYGNDRLIENFQKNCDKKPDQIIKSLLDSMEGYEQGDDITLVAVEKV